MPPSALTVVVPFIKSEDMAIFGYGIGTGPPGEGVLHTSGIVAVVIPLLPLWHSVKLLMLMVIDMLGLRSFVPMVAKSNGAAKRCRSAAGPAETRVSLGITSRPCGCCQGYL